MTRQDDRPGSPARSSAEGSRLAQVPPDDAAQREAGRPDMDELVGVLRRAIARKRVLDGHRSDL